MIGKTLQMGSSEVVVVGPIYNKVEKLPLIEKVADGRTVVMLGDICHPYNSISEAVDRVRDLRGFFEDKNRFYLLGDKDLVFMKKIINSHGDTYEWLSTRAKAIRFTFTNNTNLLVVHGGVLPTHSTWQQVQSDPESAFITNLKDSEKEKPWHESYDGRFGYVISSHLASSEVKFYNNSLSLDTNCHETNKLAVQVYGPNGAGETLYL